jgi:hypothetical protein
LSASWAKIGVEITQHLVRLLPRRLQALIEAKCTQDIQNFNIGSAMKQTSRCCIVQLLFDCDVVFCSYCFLINLLKHLVLLNVIIYDEVM